MWVSTCIERPSIHQLFTDPDAVIRALPHRHFLGSDQRQSECERVRPGNHGWGHRDHVARDQRGCPGRRETVRFNEVNGRDVDEPLAAAFTIACTNDIEETAVTAERKCCRDWSDDGWRFRNQGEWIHFVNKEWSPKTDYRDDETDGTVVTPAPVAHMPT